MNIKKTLIPQIIVVVLLAAASPAESQILEVSQISGLVSADSVAADVPITFTFYMKTPPQGLTGGTNGFRVFLSSDGTVGGMLNPGPGFQAITWETLVDFEAAGYTQYFESPFGIDGLGADTIGFGGLSFESPMLIDADVWTITTQVDGSLAGSGIYLCLDSSFYPPGGAWLWSTPTGPDNPAWDGPHCFAVASGPTGACCDVLDGTCRLSIPTDCNGANEVYQGDYTTCDPNPCIEAYLGACCDIVEQSCRMTSESLCNGQDEWFHGVGTSCVPNPCESVGWLILSDVSGLAAGDTVQVDSLIRFTFELIHPLDAETHINTLHNGFQVYTKLSRANPSVPGLFDPVVFDTLSLGWSSWFDLGCGLSEFGVDGLGADTVAFTCVTMSLPGIPGGTQTDVWWLETTAYEIGDTLCVDSAYYPPSGVWMWTLDQPVGDRAPFWGGPYCFYVNKVGACCDTSTGDCRLTSLLGCAGEHEVFSGYDTDCDPNPCPQPPIGACCDMVRGDCRETSQLDCDGPDEVYQGDGTNCLNVQSSFEPLGDGADHYVVALTEHEGMLVAGGAFTEVDGAPMGRIASWNGSNWSSMGSMSGTVLTFSEYAGKLIAGGWFALADGEPVNYIAQWDNGTWSSLGSGMGWYVVDLTVYDGDLVAGGAFTTAGGTTAYGVARWNGSAWQAMGGLVPNDVCALMEYNGELIAGGRFEYNLFGELIGCIARWNGTKWVPLGSGIEGQIWALTVYNGELIAGGWFSEVGGLPASCIARWDGSAWHPLGNGWGVDGYVRDLLVIDDDLIVAGSFNNAGHSPASKVARWDGSSWHQLSDDVLDDLVLALAVYQDNMVLGGQFTRSGCELLGRIASFDFSGCCVYRGDADHSGVLPIDISDLVYLVDYMFTGGPAPVCWDEGDIDGSGIEPIDISDLVYLVDYMFTGGPEPPPCP